jgi:hypothetical protein
MKLLKRVWWIFPTILLSIILFDLDSFVEPFITLLSKYNGGAITTRYAAQNKDIFIQATTSLSEFIIKAFNFIKDFDITSFLFRIAENMLIVMNLAINFGFNIFLIFYLFLFMFTSGETEVVRVTSSASFFVKLMRLFSRLKTLIIRLLKWIQFHKSKIIISVLIVTFTQGILLNLMTEIILFVIYYFKTAFDIQSHVFMYDIFRSIIIFMTLEIHPLLLILIIIIAIYFYSLSRAEAKLEKNFYDFKAFIKFETHNFTIILGRPSKGKTRLMTQCALATEEVWIDEIEEELHEIEMSHPEVNWGEIEKDTYQWKKVFPEHYKLRQYILDDCSMIASAPFAILDPYADSPTVMLKSKYIKPNAEDFQAVLDKRKVFVYSELDKEYNSHYSKEEVGEDGMYITVGTITHWTERLSKLFIDYQQATQVPLNLRGNADKFIVVQDTRHRFPFLLSLFKLPWELVYSLVKSLINAYESRKPRLAKDTRRRGQKIRKRHDYTLFYAILRYSIYYVSRVLSWFHKFGYLIFICDLQDKEDQKVGSVKLRVNYQDESWRGSRLYDSTFLSQGYQYQKSKDDLRWEELERYSSIYPTPEELRKLDYRFVNKSFFKESSQKVEDVVHPSTTGTKATEEPELKFK